MKNYIPLLLLLLPILFGSCVMNKVQDTPEAIILLEDMGGREISFDLKKGESYSSRMKAGPLIFNILPQTVIWAEDDGGRLIKTLYITGADGKGFRHAGRKELGEQFYRESFPLWSSRMADAGQTLPGEDNSYPDSVTSATPTAGFTLSTRLDPLPGKIHLFAEINQSSDYNEAYTEENSGWAGQPSVIYHASVPGKTGTSPAKYRMELYGRGGNIGEGLNFTPDTSGLDTALDQIDEIRIEY